MPGEAIMYLLYQHRDFFTTLGFLCFQKKTKTLSKNVILIVHIEEDFISLLEKLTTKRHLSKFIHGKNK
jgi:hypothetical protein